MCGVLALLFFAVPAVEIYVLFQVGGVLGAGSTLLLVAVTALAGAYLARRQGLAALRGLQESLAGGREVGRAATEAVLVLVAGITLLTPGFVTDAVGLALLAPPLRRRLARLLADKWAGNAMVMDLTPPWQQGRRRGADDEDPPPPGVIDV